jgi:hypothetical protein
MSVEIGQENPGQAFNKNTAGYRAYMLDDTIEVQDVLSNQAFITKWNQLDHANLVAVNMFQNQRYGRFDRDAVAKWFNYKVMVHTNDADNTWYWLTDDDIQLNWGLAVDIPVDAHAYPMIVRDISVTHDQELLADKDNTWN